MIFPQIRHTHPAGFRSGEWAWLGEVKLVEQPDGSFRPCYRIAFEDGKTDLWAVYDSDEPYEFRNVNFIPEW